MTIPRSKPSATNVCPPPLSSPALRGRIDEGGWTRKTYREILRAISSGRIINGDALHELQVLVSKSLGVRSVLLCGSGSLALELALRACGVQPGDEIVIPTFCCI